MSEQQQEEQVSPRVREMRARVEALKAKSFKPSKEEEELTWLAREELAEHARIDGELGDKLQREADIALADARAKLADKLAKDHAIDPTMSPREVPPLDAIWSLEAYKLCGVGWLVLGSDDKGAAALALRASGKLDGSGKFKIQENDPDICRVAVQRACVASPVPKDELSRRLVDAPEFVVACHARVKQLGAALVQDATGKSTG